MLTWVKEKGSLCFKHLTLKSNDAIVATVDIRTDGIKHIRIRAVWRKSQDFSTYNDKTGDYFLVNNEEKLNDYCLERWQTWKNKAGLIAIEDAQ